MCSTYTMLLVMIKNNNHHFKNFVNIFFYEQWCINGLPKNSTACAFAFGGEGCRLPVEILSKMFCMPLSVSKNNNITRRVLQTK